MPAAPLVSFQYVRLVLEQVLDKADTVVFEDDLAAVLRGVQIDIAHDAKDVVAILVGKDLMHVPHVTRSNPCAMRCPPCATCS